MKTIWRTIGGLILGGALLLPTAQAATGFGDSPVFAVNLLGLTNGLSVSGTVLDGNTGTGLVGALVQLGANSTVSGSQGAYSFSSVAMGDYTLTGSKPGYNDASYSVTISAGSSLSRMIVLAPTNASGSLPSVTSVKSKYADSSYYLDGVLFSVSFTANVDWAGHPPGTVQFITPQKTYTATASGSTASQTLAMGSDFGPNGRLRVVAVSGDGAQSSPKMAGFAVMPGFLPALWGLDDEGGTFKYNATLDISFFDEGAKAGDIPSNIPVFGGQPLKLSFLPEADFEIDSDGSAQVSVHGLDFRASKQLGHDPPSPADLKNMLDKLLHGGFDSSLFPQAAYGGIDLDLFPFLGGGWQYSSSASKWQYKDAFVGVGGEFSIQQTWPFLAGPVPMFVKAKFDVSAEITAQLNYDMSMSGALNVNPSLRGSLGVGVSEVLSAEGWIEGGVNMGLSWSPQLRKDFSFYTRAGATVYALLWHWDYSGFYWSWPDSSPHFARPRMLLTLNGKPQPLGRDYLRYPASGSFGAQTGPKPNLFGTGGGGTNPEILMSPAMPYAEPNCSSSGTNLYLVFLEDNTNRTSMNRTMAMFSQFNGTLWSMPVAIADDGTADFHPRILTFADGSAVAAWENENVALPDSTTYEGMKSNLEVSVAWYNPGTLAWLPAQLITTNDYIDRSPKMAGRTTNNVLLTWIANPANDASGGSTAPNQIWSAKWNGSAWGTPQLAASVSNALVKYDLVYDGTNGNLVMSLDMVDNSTNANGHELFRVPYQGGAWGAMTQLTSDQAPDDEPQMAFDSQGNIVLTWLKGAELSSALNFSMTNRQVVRTNEYSSNLADFKLAASGSGNLVLLWPEPSENDSDLYAVSYDPVFQTWGGPRQLTHDPQAEHGTTAAFYGSNEVIAVYNRSLISSTNSPDSSLSDLMALYYTLGEDLALDGNLFYSDPANPNPGGLATFHVTALNIGDKVETNVVVAFYQGAVQPASEIGRVAITNAIPPQGSNDVTFAWAVPSINNPISMFAVIDPDDAVQDVSRSNNVARLDILKPDAGIQSMNWSRVSSNLLAVTVHVANDGAVSNGTFTLSLNQDSLAGSNLFNQDISGLAPGQSMDVTFIWNVAGLPNNVNVFATLGGSGITNNFSTASTTSELSIIQVPAPWIGDCQYLTNGVFQLAVYGGVGQTYTLTASTNLANWVSVLNFTCTNTPTYVVDPGATYSGWRFYRVAQ